MGLKTITGIAIALLVLGFGTLYMRDSRTVEQALVLETFFNDYCRKHNKYPEPGVVEENFPELYPGREWYYWPNESRTVATFQYPMMLPLSSAPGRSKLSEFIPIIYSYAVHHPCQDIL